VTLSLIPEQNVIHNLFACPSNHLQNIYQCCFIFGCGMDSGNHRANSIPVILETEILSVRGGFLQAAPRTSLFLPCRYCSCSAFAHGKEPVSLPNFCVHCKARFNVELRFRKDYRCSAITAVPFPLQNPCTKYVSAYFSCVNVKDISLNTCIQQWRVFPAREYNRQNSNVSSWR
jgi:hypothetical protein